MKLTVKSFIFGLVLGMLLNGIVLASLFDDKAWRLGFTTATIAASYAVRSGRLTPSMSLGQIQGQIVETFGILNAGGAFDTLCNPKNAR